MRPILLGLFGVSLALLTISMACFGYNSDEQSAEEILKKATKAMKMIPKYTEKTMDRFGIRL